MSLPDRGIHGAAIGDHAAPMDARPKRRRAKVVLGVLVGLALLGAGIAYLAARGHERTDDAQVEGHVSLVAARISGQVKRVLVTDNQEVKAGDVLIEIDDRDLASRLAAARAEQQAARAQVLAANAQLALAQATTGSRPVAIGDGQDPPLGSGTRAAVVQAGSDLQVAAANARVALIDLRRAQTLYRKQAIPRAELDVRRAASRVANASLAAARARRVAATDAGPVQIELARAQLAVAQGRATQADAMVEQAELNHSYATVRAAVAGTVARRTVEPGNTVSPDRALLAIVSLEDPWIVANFKEDQVRRIRPGQTAEVQVDTYGSASFHGHIDSLAPGTGSRFTLLPPDNSSGNFTKVVQRVPVIVRLDKHPDRILRPGMSATVTVATND